tara:strand:- start:82 stop:468 length:387 start_codon:yes stop_codon:yes gene_type:complete
MKKDELIQLIKDNTDQFIKANSYYNLDDQIKKVSDYGIDKIKELEQKEIDKYLKDQELHHYMYNEDYFIIYYYDGKKFINNEFFNMLELMLDYDDIIEEELFKKNNLNESSFSNLFAYVVGNELIEYK